MSEFHFNHFSPIAGDFRLDSLVKPRSSWEYQQTITRQWKLVPDILAPRSDPLGAHYTLVVCGKKANENIRYLSSYDTAKFGNAGSTVHKNYIIFCAHAVERGLELTAKPSAIELFPIQATN